MNAELRIHFANEDAHVGHDLQSDDLSLFLAATCRMICSQPFAIEPTSTGLLYFGVQRQWYLPLYTTLLFDL